MNKNNKTETDIETTSSAPEPKNKNQSSSDDKEREMQKKVCEEYVIKLHADFFRAGFRNGSRKANEFKSRIPRLLESDEGGIWTAGQFLKTQLRVETETPDKCRFKLDREVYKRFIDTVKDKADHLKEFDEDTYNDDIDVSEFISKRVNE